MTNQAMGALFLSYRPARPGEAARRRFALILEFPAKGTL